MNADFDWGRGLDRLMAPRSVAVIGASSNANRIGGRPLDYLNRFGYTGRVYAVNPKYGEVQGRRSFPSVTDLPEAVDLAVICLPAEDVLDTAEACAARGIGAAVIFAAGFAEAGAEGRAQQEALTALAARSGMRIVGPNSLGYRDQNNGVFATFGTDVDGGVRPGRLAMVSQSGGLGGYFGVALPRSAGLGTRYFIDTGNEADVETAECIEYFSRDPEVSAIGIIIEGCRDGRKLMAACALARERGKPVVALKVGRSERGARQAQSHTGALAGEDRVWSAGFTAAGAVRAQDEVEFFDLINLYSTGRSPAGRGLGIFTLSGGVATLALDACADLGLHVPPITPPPPELVSRLPAMHFTNPLDASGHTANAPETIGPLLSHLLDQEKVDTVVFWLAYGLLSPVMGPVMADQVVAAVAGSRKPLYVCGMATPELQDRLQAAGVPIFTYPSRLMNAISLAANAPVPAPPPALPAPAPAGARRVLTGRAAQLALPGIPFTPTRPAASATAAVQAAAALGYPAVLKGEAEGVAHKTELGLVRVGLPDAAAVGDAFAALQERLPAGGEILVQPMVAGTECYAGYKVDPLFGPVVTFGLGGILVEHLKDVAVLLAPVTPEHVLAALQRLQGYPLLQGVRGQPPRDVAALSAVVAQLSRLAADRPQVREVDLNPIIVGPAGSGAVAVDAVVIQESAGEV